MWTGRGGGVHIELQYPLLVLARPVSKLIDKHGVLPKTCILFEFVRLRSQFELNVLGMLGFCKTVALIYKCKQYISDHVFGSLGRPMALEFIS